MRYYYVTVINKKGDFRPLNGPHDTHEQALDAVLKTKQKALRVDPKASFYAFGTSLLPDGYDRKGILE